MNISILNTKHILIKEETRNTHNLRLVVQDIILIGLNQIKDFY